MREHLSRTGPARHTGCAGIAAGPDLRELKKALVLLLPSANPVVLHPFSSSTHAMCAIISGWLFLVVSTAATPLQLAATSLLNASSLNSTCATTILAISNLFQCFTPAFLPPGPFSPIRSSRCIDAADKMLENVRAHVPMIFSRCENADVQLPWRVRSGDCMMSVDVLNKDDVDIMCIQDVHAIALALCRICVRGYYKYGGRTPVGPRAVVYISVYATTTITVEAAGLAAPQTSDVVVGGQIERRGSGLLNASSLATIGVPVLNASNADEGECFGQSGPSARRHLYPAESLDCLNAADEMLKNRRPHKPMTFGRRAGMDFQLPWRARSHSCIVILDTLNGVDFDTIVLLEVYHAVLNRVEECTTGANRFGGKMVVGSKKVVWVFVFGFGSPLRIPASASSSAPTYVVARAQIERSNELSLLNAPSSQTIEPLNLTSAPMTQFSTPLRGIPECFDPPLPRERSVPISNFTDCETATTAIVGSRPRRQIYIFSRKPSTDPDYYQLPATFRIRSCVVHLDMEDENDEDSVRLTYVESTAWVLAHKCSGLEVPEQKWGGTVTVSVGANDLIRVWVYGAVAPSSEGPSLSPVASLLDGG